MMAMRSESKSASSMKCVVSTMARPRLCWRIISHVMRRECGSMPLVGSSRNTTLGLPRKAMDTLSLRFWPPDSVYTRACSFSGIPRSVTVLRMPSSCSLSGMP
mmetsp:Transcript_18733/g.35696  ORF Transcript_18733/g.35696 Transcript_18733/m.35696 type:complete len:103 (-) Transcript_18733:2371-2679(-)